MTHPNDIAYPSSETGHNSTGMQVEFFYPGLTKRELFAAMAMQGRLSSPYGSTGDPEFAKDCITIADELIEVLNQY